MQVIEVNAGSLRSKSQLLHKLKEVTLSQRVQAFSWPTQAKKSLSLSSNTLILFEEVYNCWVDNSDVTLFCGRLT